MHAYQDFTTVNMEAICSRCRRPYRYKVHCFASMGSETALRRELARQVKCVQSDSRQLKYGVLCPFCERISEKALASAFPRGIRDVKERSQVALRVVLGGLAILCSGLGGITLVKSLKEHGDLRHEGYAIHVNALIGLFGFAVLFTVLAIREFFRVKPPKAPVLPAALDGLNDDELFAVLGKSYGKSLERNRNIGKSHDTNDVYVYKVEMPFSKYGFADWAPYIKPTLDSMS